MRACQLFEQDYAQHKIMRLASAFQVVPSATTLICGTLDDDLPPLMYAPEMPDALLKQRCADIASKTMDIDDDEDGDASDWLQMQESFTYSETAIQEFSDSCIKTNVLCLAPDLEQLVYDLSVERMALSDEESSQYLENRVLLQQLQWMRRVVLPWLSHIVQNGSGHGTLEKNPKFWTRDPYTFFPCCSHGDRMVRFSS